MTGTQIAVLALRKTSLEWRKGISKYFFTRRPSEEERLRNADVLDAIASMLEEVEADERLAQQKTERTP